MNNKKKNMKKTLTRHLKLFLYPTPHPTQILVPNTSGESLWPQSGRIVGVYEYPYENSFSEIIKMDKYENGFELGVAALWSLLGDVLETS